MEDDTLRDHMAWLAARLATEDPCHGLWCVRCERAVVQTDASSLAVVLATPQGDEAIEEAAWLRHDDSSHINMAELDAAVLGPTLPAACRRVLQLTCSGDGHC